MAFANRFFVYLLLSFTSWKQNLVPMVQERKTQYNAWFLILLAVLLVLAFTIFAALTIWCVVYQGKAFSGNWHWGAYGTSVWAECK
jgi:membrane glycosyltransferase